VFFAAKKSESNLTHLLTTSEQPWDTVASTRTAKGAMAKTILVVDDKANVRIISPPKIFSGC
jgi:hypothetical protein